MPPMNGRSVGDRPCAEALPRFGVSADKWRDGCYLGHGTYETRFCDQKERNRRQ